MNPIPFYIQHNGKLRGTKGRTKLIGSIINVVVLMRIKTATFIFCTGKKHGKFLVQYQSTKTNI